MWVMIGPARVTLLDYALELLQRVSSGVLIPSQPGVLPGWRASENECHNNADEWCARSLGDTRVRGWLYFSFENCRSYVRFAAHSVVRIADGTLRDITPTKASMPYPFIRALESPPAYDAFINYNLIKQLELYPREGRVVPIRANPV